MPKDCGIEIFSSAASCSHHTTFEFSRHKVPTCRHCRLWSVTSSHPGQLEGFRHKPPQALSSIVTCRIFTYSPLLCARPLIPRQLHNRLTSSIPTQPITLFANMSIIGLGLRGLQFLWILLCMALVGNMLAIQGGPSVINYDMFVAVFCMLALFYLTLVSVKESFVIHPIFPLVLDALCTLFTLIAGIATAAYLRVRSCSNRVSILASMISSSQRANNPYRATFSPTLSLVAAQLDAVKVRPSLPSSGSPSQPSSPPPS
jgi:hypothetical protein